MKRRNTVLAYINDKKYYLSLFGCLVVTVIALIIIYSGRGKEEQQIANLNEVIGPQEVAQNPVDLEKEIIPVEDMILDEVPNVSIHQENVEVAMDTSEIIEIKSPDEPVVEDASEQTVDAFVDEAQEAQITEVAVQEETVPALNPIIGVNTPNLTFDASSKMLTPLEGNWIMSYSEKPVYFKTLDQYRLSSAVLIAAQVGEEVRAASDGIVEEIRNDYATGCTITIFHGNGYKSVYGQLQEAVNVSVGDTVSKGDILGYVSEPKGYYTLEGSHLYFQVLSDGKPVNPETFLQ